MSKVTYRGYFIQREPKPIPTRAYDWDYWHDSYSGPGDPRHGVAGSLEAAMREIDELLSSVISCRSNFLTC